jgi:hypothetical protein
VDEELQRHITTNERKFLKAKLDKCDDPFPFFYLTMKVHKTPPHVPSSLQWQPLEGIGIDSKLKSLLVDNAPTLKLLCTETNASQFELPPNARLFTADAVSMYTNIPTHFE